MIAQHRVFFASPESPIRKVFDRIIAGLDALALTFGSFGESLRAARILEAELMSQRSFDLENDPDYSALVRSAFACSFAKTEGKPAHRGLPTSPVMAEETVDECLTVARAELSLAESKLSAEIRAYPAQVDGYEKHMKDLFAKRKHVVEALKALSHRNVRTVC